jgi:MFS family permease
MISEDYTIRWGKMSKTSLTQFKLPLGARLLGGVSFLNDVASEMVYPLLPAYLSRTLGAGPAFIGLLEGFAESISSLSKGWFGAWSDRARRREPFVVAGYFFAVVARPLLALANLPSQVFGIRLLDRFGKGLRTAPRDAWLASLAPAEARGRVFGFHRAMDHLGSVGGPLLASAFLWRYPEAYRALFACTLLPGVLVLLLLLWAVSRAPASRAPAKEQGTVAAATAQRGGAASSWQSLPGAFRRYLWAVGLFTLGNSTDAFLLLRLQQSGAPVAALPLLWAALHVVKSGVSIVGGRIADRFGPKKPILAAWGWYGFIYFVFAMDLPLWPQILAFLAYGIFYGLSEGPEKVWIARLMPQKKLGTAFGLFHGVVGLGALPASLIFGFIWERWGPSAAFGTGMTLAFLGMAVLMTVEQETVRQETTARG